MAKPVLIATWRFGKLACEAGWEVLAAGGAALDAVEKGANAVEEDPEVTSVGLGGIPNCEGVIELDAAIMDGRDHSAGAVAGITGIRKPISVARRVMERTPHVMLVGDNARRFALRQGFSSADLHTEESRRRFHAWRLERSAPDVAHFDQVTVREREWSEPTHDTVGICALDDDGNLAAGCTTSGLAWKLPGRVGDSPIVGSGLYVDNEAGAAAATGNGDEMMKACLTYRVVCRLAEGMDPQLACEEAIRYLLRKRPGHQEHGASVIAVAKDGRIGNAATRSGFHAPDRLWQYAVVSDGQVRVDEGVYVDG